MGRPGGLLLLPLLLAAPGGAGSCQPQPTCEECIRSHPRCAWCEEPDFTRGGQAEASRCAPREALERAGCPPQAVLEPRGGTRVLEDEELGGAGGARTQSRQLRPQRMELELRPGEELALEVRFRRAGGLPLDLYYLMDLSYSMRDDLHTLRRLGSDLLAALRNASASVRIGFGAFVDKPVLPFVSTVPSKLQNPCPERGQPCDPPAAFRHLLSLTADAGEFTRRLEGQRISGNLDAPEGGFDAMMQVALCQERIGWRPVTRLLVFASDDAFHTAGDGRLAGIVLPSDSRCHLDASGVYNRSHLYDYPSVGHLAQVLSAANIQPIFAVTRPTVPLYKELSRLIPKSVVGELRDDSSNVVQLITDAYNSLTSTVELQHSPLPPGLSLSFQAHCGGPPEPPQPHRGLCSGVRVNQQVTFTVRVRAEACLEAPQHVALRVLGVPEQLQLGVRTLCHCPCTQRATSTPLCSGGDLDCGVCRCPGGRRGRRCECEGPEAEEEVWGGCRPPNSTAPPCSGRGHCVCGTCECPPGLSGRFCECDSSACERHEGLPCGGPQRGTCECGRCRCLPGFAGSGCGCSLGGAAATGGAASAAGGGTASAGAAAASPASWDPSVPAAPPAPGPASACGTAWTAAPSGGGPCVGTAARPATGRSCGCCPPRPPRPPPCAGRRRPTGASSSSSSREGAARRRRRKRRGPAGKWWSPSGPRRPPRRTRRRWRPGWWPGSWWGGCCWRPGAAAGPSSVTGASCGASSRSGGGPAGTRTTPCSGAPPPPSSTPATARSEGTAARGARSDPPHPRSSP